MPCVIPSEARNLIAGRTPLKQFHVYIMTNWPRGVLYVGVTSTLPQRVARHKSGSHQLRSE